MSVEEAYNRQAYIQSQFDKLTDLDSVYLPTIQLSDSVGNRTNHINISGETARKILELLKEEG